MAATAWQFYNNFKKALGNGSIDLTGTNTSFIMRLYSSASNAATASLVSGGEVTNELPADNNYSQKALVNPNWSVKTTTSTFSWSFDTVVFTAGAASAMTNIKYAVILTQTASILVCWSQLSTAEITVPAGLEYHIYSSSAKICFELN